METLETLGKRIATTKDLQSIVRTMKSLSSVSIRQYEQATVALARYNQTIERGLQVLLRDRPVPEEKRPQAEIRTAAIVFGSDHGLCGRFNEQICRFACREMQQRVRLSKDRLFLAVGEQAATRLGAMDETIDDCIHLPGAVSGLTATAHAILQKVDSWQSSKDIASVLVFRNARSLDATAAPEMIQLLPLDVQWLQALSARPWPSRVLPMHRMESRALFSSLVREHLFVSIFQAAAESTASEHATRLASMQAAERNIQEHLQEMTGAYRQRRQQAITEELLDVVAGFESLRSSKSIQEE